MRLIPAHRTHGPIWVLIGTAAAPAVWGTTYLVATEMLPTGRPMLAAALRALPIGLVMAARTRALPEGGWWWKAVALGVLNVGAFQGLLFVAAFRLPGGMAATVGAIQPLVAAGLAAVFLGESFTPRAVLAGLAGIGGVALLVLQNEARLDPVGLAAALAATLAMATGVVLTKHWDRPVDLFTFTGWQLTIGGLILLPVALATEGLPSALSATNLAGFAWLGVVGTGVAYAFWFRGIDRLPVSMTSPLVLLSPLVATSLGWLALDQSLTPPQVAGAALVAIAVVGPQIRRGLGLSRWDGAWSSPITAGDGQTAGSAPVLPGTATSLSI